MDQKSTGWPIKVWHSLAEGIYKLNADAAKLQIWGTRLVMIITKSHG